VFLFLGQNGALYITYPFFTQPAAGEKSRGFGGQNDAIYTHFGCQNGAIYTHFEFCFWVKMLPYIYTHLFFFGGGGVKMLPYVHVLGFFLGENAAIYTHFWNLIFPEKTEKKKQKP
jgi:hypothetical protein